MTLLNPLEERRPHVTSGKMSVRNHFVLSIWEIVTLTGQPRLKLSGQQFCLFIGFDQYNLLALHQTCISPP